jgi:hypothetical protein
LWEIAGSPPSAAEFSPACLTFSSARIQIKVRRFRNSWGYGPWPGQTDDPNHTPNASVEAQLDEPYPKYVAVCPKTTETGHHMHPDATHFLEYLTWYQSPTCTLWTLCQFWDMPSVDPSPLHRYSANVEERRKPSPFWQEQSNLWNVRGKRTAVQINQFKQSWIIEKNASL